MPLLNEEFFVGTLERKRNYHTNGQKHYKTNICLVISQTSCRLKVKKTCLLAVISGLQSCPGQNVNTDDYSASLAALGQETTTGHK